MKFYIFKGSFIFTIATMSSWIWQISIHENDKFALVSDDGEVTVVKTN